MFQSKQLLPLLAALLLFLPACAGEAQPADTGISEISIRETVTQADPEAAVAAIYKTLPDTQTQKLGSYELSTHFADLKTDNLLAYFGRLSNSDKGLADLIIFQPAEGARDQARDALHQYQEKRIREFENYDILGAFNIAKNALVIDQGDYVILLMLPDNNAARDIIDLHIPL